MNTADSRVASRAADRLMTAAKAGSLVTLNALLETGVDIHTDDDRALCLAASNGRLEAVNFLLCAGANVHGQDDGPLCWAARYGHVDVVIRLIAAGANVRAMGDQALIWTLRHNHLEVACVLLNEILEVPFTENDVRSWAVLMDHPALTAALSLMPDDFLRSTRSATEPSRHAPSFPSPD